MNAYLDMKMYQKYVLKPIRIEPMKMLKKFYKFELK